MHEILRALSINRAAGKAHAACSKRCTPRQEAQGNARRATAPNPPLRQLLARRGCFSNHGPTSASSSSKLRSRNNHPRHPDEATATEGSSPPSTQCPITQPPRQEAQGNAQHCRVPATEAQRSPGALRPRAARRRPNPIPTRSTPRRGEACLRPCPLSHGTNTSYPPKTMEEVHFISTGPRLQNKSQSLPALLTLLHPHEKWYDFSLSNLPIGLSHAIQIRFCSSKLLNRIARSANPLERRLS